ncbi:MAG TPA: NAD-dependent epimerase/dehydratase family protein [Gaiellaceae bacterium]|nr:NAD-dependent epimerase/dehydratase family protein [Gaiellaceae bacterium]
MRVFVAGASGVLGVRLVPLLVAAGHEVAGMTRTPGKLELLRSLGAKPVLCDVYDAVALRGEVVAFGPEAVVNELTDLPDEAATMNEANARMRRDGTHNLLAAAMAALAPRFVAQSIAWQLPGDAGAAVAELERVVLDAGGVVVRYGRLYGPGTYYEDERPEPPRVQVDAAARRTIPALDGATRIVEVTEDS